MVFVGESACPRCKRDMKGYCSTRRIVRTKGGSIYWVKIRRLICTGCGSVHNELPAFLLPYKHYEEEIIRGILMGTLDRNDLDYEDYPTDTTVKRWMADNSLRFNE